MKKTDRVVCVVGPTGCGKTKMGVLLAKAFNGEVVSCDSMQLYRGMVIGTAAPTTEETEDIAHHMVGVIDPNDDYSVARYARDAAKCVDDILSRGKLPILVGGTGLYLDALLRGTDFADGQRGGAWRDKLEARMETEGADVLLAELSAVDPDTAAKLSPADHKRIIRALEMYYETGKTKTQHDRESQRVPQRYEPVYLGFAYEDREEMKRIINLRVDIMVRDGLFEEVRALLDAGVPRTSTAFAAIGYKEALAYLDGNASREDAIAEIKLRSRQYAKRQLTWLRRNKAINWYYWKKTRDFQSALAFSTEILTNNGVC